MRIGIDCRTILSPAHGEKAGVGHYTYYLVKNLLQIDQRNTYVLFFDHRANNAHEFKRRRTEIVRFPLSEYKRYLPYAYSHLMVSRTLNQAQLDVFHAPANSIPLQYHKPTVVTVHDLAIYQHPEWFPPKQNFSINVLVPKSVQRANAVIAVSQSTAQDIRRQFKVPANHIRVIYEGYAAPQLPTKLGAYRVLRPWHLQEHYLLYIGTLEPRKNIAGLITAFDSLAKAKPKRYHDVQLVIAGAKGYQFHKNYEAIQAVKSGHIRYVGYVTGLQKAALLRCATAFVFPSFYEGFGLPVVEAMSYGVPVITSNVASLPEVVGKAGVLVNPQSTRAVQQAIDRVVGSAALRQRLGRAGRQRVKQFSWTKCAQETLQVYDQVYHG
ncbi:MAG: glycosyltransferase family 4 protein [Candidatus Kerfeldbacteria bacterium]|nr:glycosyltransferase family 4 protein [Candidatus Kerfeldbacteria bacterium]